MTMGRIKVSAKIFALLLAVLASGLSGCKGSAIPGVTTPDLALSTPPPPCQGPVSPIRPAPDALRQGCPSYPMPPTR